MRATWFQDPADEFIRVSKEGWEKGVSIPLFLGGISIGLGNNRAVSQTKMAISQRGNVDSVLCNIVCTGRFYDFLKKRDSRWDLVLRRPIYEKDTLATVSPSAKLELDSGLLARFPAGYHHLAYIQTRIGYKVKPDMPDLKGPEVESLCTKGASWLGGVTL